MPKRKKSDGTTPAVSTVPYVISPCVVCGLMMLQTDKIVFLEDCQHRFHELCIDHVFRNAQLTEYQGCPICLYVPRRMWRETRGPTHCRAAEEVQIPMSKLSSLLYSVLLKENVIPDFEDIPICTRVLEKFYVFIATGMDVFTSSMLYEELLKSKFGRLCKRMVEEIADEHPDDIRAVRMSRALKSRATVSAKNCVASMKADEYVRFKPQTDICESSIKAFAGQLVKEGGKGTTRFMCNVYSIGIENEPTPGPSNHMDELFSPSPVPKEEVDPRESLLAKIKAKREARSRRK